MYKFILRPFLFLFDPERAHTMASSFLKMAPRPWLRRLFKVKSKVNPAENFEVMGLNFPSRLGLAAGFDKDATMFQGLAALGFGFVEVGTVTPEPQSGNPKPRLFRLPNDKSLINRMGFNNNGVYAMAEKLRGRDQNAIVGGNIGKNKMTPNDQALNDYETCFNVLFDLVDYFVVNVSSPNTPGLRELQDKDPLKKILNGLQKNNFEHDRQKPILLKIAPDLNESQLDEVLEIVQETGIQGIVATNTTIERNVLKNSDQRQVDAIGAGGLSGQVLAPRSLEVVSYLREKGSKDMTIIGVGGIFSQNDARKMMDAGADLIQIYTGFIYQGPDLVQKINEELSSHA